MITRVLFSLLLLLSAEAVLATDNYSYKADEYATISDGRSPDSRWSIASHGGGNYGYDGFDLYLMREPAHEKLVPLHIGEHLDTAPLSNIALWSADSTHVVIFYRTDRHVLDMQLFAIADGKVRSIKVPSLLDVVGKRHLRQGVHRELFGRLFRVTWQQADRFNLQESDTFDAAQPIFSPGLESYVTLDRLGPQRTFTSFSAEATCEISKKDELHFSAVKALPESNWSKAIKYSPHLLFDTKNGLHSTETTMSSLDAQKNSK